MGATIKGQSVAALSPTKKVSIVAPETGKPVTEDVEEEGEEEWEEEWEEEGESMADEEIDEVAEMKRQ